MSKTRRPSLAAFAATGETNPAPQAEPATNVVTLPREEPRAPAPTPITSPREDVATSPRGDVKRVRNDKPHTTIYIPKVVQKRLREIALAYDCKPHDLLIEGVNLMLAKYGSPSVAELSKKEA